MISSNKNYYDQIRNNICFARQFFGKVEIESYKKWKQN